PKPMPPKRQAIQAARIQPGPSSSRRAAPPRSGGGPCTSWSALTAVTSSNSPLLARVDQVLDERVQLLLRQRLAERLRHHVLRVVLLDVRVRVDDRLAHERLARLSRPLRFPWRLVQVGT